MSITGLEFLLNTGGDSEGLSEAGIETFRDKPFAAVARETGQNSRDARLDAAKPVRVTFDVVTVKSSDFPSIAEFRESVRLCLKKATRPGNEKEKGFFQHAARVLDAPEIKILRISDYNTTGVRGPCEEGQPFHTLAKSDGVSTKDDISSGGSFGIGKNAVFALSDIQTAFFSTLYKGGDGIEHFLCMGKAMLMSHVDGNGKERRRKGYWGRTDGYMPITDRNEVPPWLRRDSQGTSIYSICMRSNRTDWRYEMTAAIIINFFCAIERQEMEFEIDNASIRINRNTLQGLFRDSNVLDAVRQLNAGVAFEAAKTLHTCLIDDKAIVTELDVKGLGKVRMRVLLRDGLGYTIGIIRNGMYITDNLAQFNEPFKRFPLHREFAIVVEPEGKNESEWFKRLENPRHDDLSAERITDPALREQGQKAFESLAKQIRARIRELAKAEPTSKLELDELNDFFASDESRQEDDAGPVTDPRALKPTQVRKSPPKPKRSSVSKREDDDDDEPPVSGIGGEVLGPGTGGGGGEDSGGGGGVAPPGPRPRPQPQARPIELEAERNLLPDAGSPRKRRLYFTSPVTGTVTLYVEATGLSVPDRLAVNAVTGGTLNDGAIEVKCSKGQRVVLDVEFDAPYAGPVETSAFATPKIEEAA